MSPTDVLTLINVNRDIPTSISDQDIQICGRYLWVIFTDIPPMILPSGVADKPSNWTPEMSASDPLQAWKYTGR